MSLQFPVRNKTLNATATLLLCVCAFILFGLSYFSKRPESGRPEIVQSHRASMAERLHSVMPRSKYCFVTNTDTGLTAIVHIPKKAATRFKNELEDINPSTTPGFAFNYNEPRFVKRWSNIADRYKNSLTVDCPKGTIIAVTLEPRTGARSNQVAAQMVLSSLEQQLWSQDTAEWDHIMSDGKKRLLYLSSTLTPNQRDAFLAVFRSVGITKRIDTRFDPSGNPRRLVMNEFFYMNRDRSSFITGAT